MCYTLGEEDIFMKSKTIRMSEETYKELKLLSVQENKPIGEMIQKLLEEYKKKR